MEDIAETVRKAMATEAPTKTPTATQAEEADKEKTLTVGGKKYSEEELARALAIMTQEKRTSADVIDDDPPSRPGFMKIASCWLKLNHLGSNVPLLKVTPAEVMLLVADHHASAGGMPVYDVMVTGEVQRSPREEVDRLLGKYPNDKVRKLFPGGIPQMPLTFKEAAMAGLDKNVNSDKLIVQVGR